MQGTFAVHIYQNLGTDLGSSINENVEEWFSLVVIYEDCLIA